MTAGIAISIILTLVSGFIYPKYRFLIEDQLLYYPMLLKKIKPELFTKDLLGQYAQSDYTLLTKIIVEITKRFGNSVKQLFFFLQLTTLFLYFFGIYQLSSFFISDPTTLYFVMASSLAPTMIFGTGIKLYELEFHPRSLSFAISILALSSAFNHSYSVAMIILAISAAIHPLTILGPLVMVVLHQLVQIYSGVAQPLSMVWSIFPVLMLGYLLKRGRSNSQKISLIQNFDPDWLQIVKKRVSYMFPTQWSRKQQLKLIVTTNIYTLIIFVYLPKHVIEYLILGIVPIGLLITTYLLGEKLKLSFIASLQLPRSLSWLYIATLVLVVNQIGSTPIGIGLSITLVLVLLIQKTPQSIPPSEYQEITKIAEWAKSNTKPSDTFVMKPNYTASLFRSLSERNIYAANKDGGQTAFYRDFAIEWQHRINTLKNFPEITQEVLTQIDYIITLSSNQLNSSPVFKTENYSIFRLSST